MWIPKGMWVFSNCLKKVHCFYVLENSSSLHTKVTVMVLLYCSLKILYFALLYAPKKISVIFYFFYFFVNIIPLWQSFYMTVWTAT